MYKVVLQKRAKKFIDKLSKNEKIRIVTAIEKLPYGEDVKRMKGHNHLFRLRVGDYRVIYSIDNNELMVIVIEIGNRGQIYNNY